MSAPAHYLSDEAKRGAIKHVTDAVKRTRIALHEWDRLHHPVVMNHHDAFAILAAELNK